MTNERACDGGEACGGKEAKVDAAGDETWAAGWGAAEGTDANDCAPSFWSMKRSGQLMEGKQSSDMPAAMSA